MIYHLSQFPLFAMILGMIVESVEKFKFLCTLLALEWSLASVRPHVDRQPRLRGISEATLTAAEWFGLQVTSFGVDLMASETL